MEEITAVISRPRPTEDHSISPSPNGEENGSSDGSEEEDEEP